MSYYGSVTSNYTPSKKINLKLVVIAAASFVLIFMIMLLIILLRSDESAAQNEIAPTVVMTPPVQLSNSITSKIPKGYRAVAIPINPVSGVEGWVVPGARVDVVWTTVTNKRPMAVTIVENAHVLSAGRKTARHNDADFQKSEVANHITLLTTLEDSHKIQLAKKSPGALTLSLRGDGDLEMVGSDVTNLDELLHSNTLASDRKSLFIGGKEFILKDDRLVSKRLADREQREFKKRLNERASIEAKFIEEQDD